jgi:dTDP-4-amino-4,6-dideoxygalactose transaminase
VSAAVSVAPAIPFLDLAAAAGPLRAELDAAYARVMDGGSLVLGPEVQAFEREFAAYCGTRHCVGVGSGLDALALVLRAWGVGPGDEVLVPGYTAVATWMAVSLLGAVPVGVDVDPVSFTIDPARLELRCSPRTRAIVPVHLCGRPADMDAVRAFAAERELPVLEDCAQAHGARFGGRRVGAIGHAGAFSFYPTKNLGAFGDGGAVTTDDDALADRLRLLRSYGWRERGASLIEGDNSRLDELQAAFLRVRLRRLDAENVRRREIAARYDDALHAVVRTPPLDPEHAWHLYVVQHPRRDELHAALAERGVGTLVHYEIPPHATRAYGGRQAAALPVTSVLAERVLSLPCHPALAPAAVERVIAAVQECGA